jgi:recombination protein RecA
MLRLKDLIKPVKALPTGSALLDHQAILVGGLPYGKIIEIFGKEASGKSTLALSFIKQAQAENMAVYLIDSEGSFDPHRAERIGIDLKDVWLLDEAETIEDGFNVLLTLLEKRSEGLLIWDSIAASPTRKEIEEGQVGEVAIAEKARAMSLALRLVSANLKNKDWILVFINQVRERIQMFGIGDRYTTPGGMALKFHASLRMKMDLVKREKEGIWSKITIAKSRVGIPYRSVEVFLRFDTGLDDYTSCLKWARKLKLIEGRKAPPYEELLKLVKTPILDIPMVGGDDDEEE